MPSTDETLLCRYHYDPLDRLADLAPTAQTSTQRFYLKSRLTSEIVGSVQRSIFQHDDQLLAQQQRKDETSETTLLATDQQRSVLQMLDAAQPHPLAYTPYGHRPQGNGLLGLLGFNGEQADPVTGHYLLGNGYRGFNPVLMRFNSPDSLSPFGEGGLNAYTYCVGDPVNWVDSTGHAGIWGMLKLIGRKLGLRQSSRVARANQINEAATNSSISSSLMNPPGARPTSVRINPIYNSSGSSSTSDSISSSYASAQSYSKIRPAPAPPMPLRPPPASSSSSSRFSTQSPQRLPTGRSPGDVQKWVDNSSIGADPELEAFTKIPDSSAELNLDRLVTRMRNGSEIAKRANKDYHQVSVIDENGTRYTGWRKN
ncbi:RHS repeat-associated core domain-containing protein [Pseudomonas sp. Z1-14]|uniref:RHS repeat-associated core domain-containing protein n=1 Tax=Pseudomonas sp. Z1-14 TaxID=2817409 RepID=UPI003DA8750C